MQDFYSYWSVFTAWYQHPHLRIWMLLICPIIRSSDVTQNRGPLESKLLLHRALWHHIDIPACALHQWLWKRTILLLTTGQGTTSEPNQSFEIPTTGPNITTGQRETLGSWYRWSQCFLFVVTAKCLRLSESVTCNPEREDEQNMQHWCWSVCLRFKFFI